MPECVITDGTVVYFLVVDKYWWYHKTACLFKKIVGRMCGIYGLDE